MADRDGQGREALAEVIANTPIRMESGAPLYADDPDVIAVADAILASDWLKAHDAKVAAAAAERIALAIEALDTHYDYTIGSHVTRTIKHPSQVRAEAMTIARADEGTR